MIVLDASALIAHLDGHDTHHDRVEALLLEHDDAALSASVVTLAETLVGPARAGLLERAQSALATLAVQPIGLDLVASAELARIRAETGLRMPDCCVLHAAEAVGAELVVTFDDRLARALAARGLGVA